MNNDERREFVNNLLSKANNIAKNNLFYGILVYESPITNRLDYRIGYFESFVEMDLWLNEVSKRYEELNIPYCTYTN